MNGAAAELRVRQASLTRFGHKLAFGGFPYILVTRTVSGESQFGLLCQAFTLDCPHLAPPLATRFVPLNNALLTGVRYDQKRRILETHMKNGDAFQYEGVSLELALMLVFSAGSSTKERI